MKYNDEILENKAFNFFKQLMYNIALAICIMLVLALIAVYGFGFRLYEVLSDSQAPEFVSGDMVVVKEQKEYVVGDIIKFDATLPVTHRLIAIYKNLDGTKLYLCHGDNVQSANPANGSEIAPWEEDSNYVQGMVDDGQSIDYIKSNTQNIQAVTFDKIEGKVVNHIDNYGTYFNFIKEHYMLLVTLVAGIWCFSTTIQNEIDMKKCRRLV